jgi:hypothetical protein
VIREAIQYLIEKCTAKEFTIHALPYVDKTVTVVNPPRPQSVDVDTLLAVESLLNLGLDECMETESFVHIRDHKTVHLKSIKSDPYGHRQLFVKAELNDACPFRFGSYHDPESFIIALNTGFVETLELKALIGLVSSLTAENVAIAEDDGVSQKATVRSGVALKTTKKVEPKVKLKPFRTFREVEQPASVFLFRLKNGGEGCPPSCALFEADGGAWKIEAVRNIEKWFKGKIANVIS